MNRVVNVRLYSPDEESDVLSFEVTGDHTIEVNLNDDSCQDKLKEVFIALFSLQLEGEIELNLVIDEAYKRMLYKEVCSEYNKDLNTERAGVRSIILEELG